jgi:GT2 family glycosyltransferase
MKSLHEIGMACNTDKAYDHNFCNFYDYHLSSLRDQPLKILEIGIWKGESLRMWKEYFPNAKIHAIDINPAFLFQEDRISTYLVDQGNIEQLTKFKNEHGPFDIVIDDGSHFTYHQFISYSLFSETLIFIWEDLHTSRMPHYLTAKNSTDEYPLDVAKRLCASEPNCYLFDRDGDEAHVTFIKINNTNLKKTYSDTAVLMSTYNRVDLTKKTIDNICNSAGTDFDLYLIDDNSSDETKNYLSSLQPFNFCKSINIKYNTENLGKAKNLNYWLKHVYNLDYSHYCVMDNDVLLPKNWLVKTTSTVKNNSEVGICSVLVETDLITKYKDRFVFTSKYIDSNLMGGPCMVWGTDVKDKIGLFCEDYGKYGHEDADFTFRCQLLGKKTVYIHDFGEHTGEDNTPEMHKTIYRIEKTKLFESSKGLLFDNIFKYNNGIKSILIK